MNTNDKNINIALVKTRTQDEITLKGLLYLNPDNEKMCLFIPGHCGNFVDNDYITQIAENLVKKGYNVLCANTRSSFQMNTSFHPLNLKKPVQIGAVNEKFEDCIYDIDAWLEFLKACGFSNADVLTHSGGSNKIIYYLAGDVQMPNISCVNNIVMLSPTDSKNWIVSYSDYLDLVEEAKTNIESGKPDKILNIHFFIKTSSSFIDWISSKNFNNLPLVNGEREDFEQFSKVNNKITVIYGEYEKFIKPYTSKLKSFSCPSSEIEILELTGADHIYFDKEKEISEVIANSLNKRYETKTNQIQLNGGK